jgi:hypothetical protein
VATLSMTPDSTPVDLSTLFPAGSAWSNIIPGGINNAGEIAATALNLNTSEVHAVLISPLGETEDDK